MLEPSFEQRVSESEKEAGKRAEVMLDEKTSDGRQVSWNHRHESQRPESSLAEVCLVRRVLDSEMGISMVTGHTLGLGVLTLMADGNARDW